jgi:AraC-like DNA-binding protein
VGGPLQRADPYARAWSIRRSKELVHVEWSSPAGTPDLGYRICNEASVAMFLRALRLLAAAPLPAAEASFLHPPPPTTEAHDAFFGCRVRFGATSAGFALDRGIVDGMIPSASNPALKAFLIEHAEALRKRIHVGADLTGEVRAALLDRLLEGDCEMTSISRHLGNHPRTLRRRLKEEGTSFQALLDDARREHALRLLQTASVTEVALSLGFSETSAFTRAFRRWMRLPPRAYRARQAAAQ